MVLLYVFIAVFPHAIGEPFDGVLFENIVCRRRGHREEDEEEKKGNGFSLHTITLPCPGRSVKKLTPQNADFYRPATCARHLVL